MKKLLVILAVVVLAFIGYRAYERATALSPEQQQVAELVTELERIENSAGQGARAGAMSGLDTGYSLDKDLADAEALQKRLKTLQEGLKEDKAKSMALQLEGKVQSFITRMKK